MESFVTRSPAILAVTAPNNSIASPELLVEGSAEIDGQQQASLAPAKDEPKHVNGKRRTTISSGGQTYLFGRAPPAPPPPPVNSRRTSKGRSKKQQQQESDHEQSSSDDNDSNGSQQKENTAPDMTKQQATRSLPLSGDDADAEGEDSEQEGSKKHKRAPSNTARGRRRVSKKHAVDPSLALPSASSTRPKRSSTQNVTYNVSDSDQPEVADYGSDDADGKLTARNGKRPRLSGRPKRSRTSVGGDVVEVIAVTDDSDKAEKALALAKQLAKQKQENEARSAALEQQHRQAMAASNKQAVNAFTLMAAKRQQPAAEPIQEESHNTVHVITNLPDAASASPSPLPNPYGHLPKGSFFMTKHERRDHINKQREEAFVREIELEKAERKRIIAESGKSTHPFLQPRMSLAPPSQADMTSTLRSPRCGTTFESTARIDFTLSSFPAANHVSYVTPLRFAERQLRLPRSVQRAATRTSPLASRLSIVNHQHSNVALPKQPPLSHAAAARAVTASTIDEYVTSAAVQQYLHQLAAHHNQQPAATQYTVQQLTQTYRRLLLRRLRCPTSSQHHQSSTPVVLDDDGTVMHTTATDEMLWTDKYQPMASQELLNCNDATVTQLKEWLQLWSTVSQQHAPTAADQLMHASQKQAQNRPSKYVDTTSDDSVDSMASSASIHNAVLLHGVTASCKTAVVYALAHELGYNVIEINSSQRRSAKDIANIVGEAAQSHRISMPAASGMLVQSQALAISPAKIKQQVKSPAKKLASPSLRKLTKPKKHKHSLVTIAESHAESDSDSPFESNNSPAKLTIRIPKKHLAARQRKKPTSSVTNGDKVAMSAASFFGAATPSAKIVKQSADDAISLLSDEKRQPVVPTTSKPTAAASRTVADVIELSSDSPVEVSSRNKQFSSANMPNAPAATNMQSLILFEEVDQVFDDDAGFFSALKRLTQTAKRPIIMTCNAVIPQVMQDIDYQPMHVEPASHTDVVLYIMLVLLTECGVGQNDQSLYRPLHEFAALHNNDLRQTLLQLQLRTTGQPLHVVTDVELHHADTSLLSHLALDDVNSAAATQDMLRLLHPHDKRPHDLLQTDVVDALTAFHDADIPLVHLNYCADSDSVAGMTTTKTMRMWNIDSDYVSLSYPLSWYKQDDATATARLLQLYGLPETDPTAHLATSNGTSVRQVDVPVDTDPIDLTSPKPMDLNRDEPEASTEIHPVPADIPPQPPEDGVANATPSVVAEMGSALSDELSGSPISAAEVGAAAGDVPVVDVADFSANSPIQAVEPSAPVAKQTVVHTTLDHPLLSSTDDVMSDADMTNMASRTLTPLPSTMPVADGSATGNDSSDMDSMLVPERKVKKRSKKARLQSKKLTCITEEPNDSDDDWDWVAHQQRQEAERIQRRRKRVLDQWQQERAEYERRMQLDSVRVQASRKHIDTGVQALSELSDMLSFTDLATTCHLPSSVLPTVERQYWRSYTRQVDYSSYSSTLNALVTADNCSDHYDVQSMCSTLAHEMVATMEVLGVQQLQRTTAHPANGHTASNSTLRVLLSDQDTSVKRLPISLLLTDAPTSPQAHAWSTTASIMQSTIYSITSLPFAADYMSILRVMFRSYQQQMMALKHEADQRQQLKREAGLTSSDEDINPQNHAATSRRRSSRQKAGKHKQHHTIDVHGYQLIARLVGKDLHFTEQEVEPLRKYLASSHALMS